MPLNDFLARWTLDDTSGTTCVEHNGLYDGTYVGSPTLNQSGLNAKAVAFTGGQHVLLPNLASQLGNNASFSCWIKLQTATPVAGANTGFMNLGPIVAAAASHYPWTDGSAYLSLFRCSGNAVCSRVGPITLPGGVTRTNWHHLAITNQPGANGWKFYVNGALVTQTAGLATVYYNNDLWVLARSSAGFSYHLDGSLDEVLLYNRTLTAHEIKQLYNNGTAKTWPWPQVYTPGSYSFPLAGVKQVNFQMISAGGDGDMTSSTGGGGGAYAAGVITNFQGESTLELNVPLAGEPSDNYTSIALGLDSIQLTNGTHGEFGGLAGALLADSLSWHTVAYDGGDGNPLGSGSDIGGGGGGGAGPSHAGDDSAGATGGTGYYTDPWEATTNTGGNGAVYDTDPAHPGIAPGGGGGGGYSFDDGVLHTAAGASGSDARIILTYTLVETGELESILKSVIDEPLANPFTSVNNPDYLNFYNPRTL